MNARLTVPTAILAVTTIGFSLIASRDWAQNNELNVQFHGFDDQASAVAECCFPFPLCLQVRSLGNDSMFEVVPEGHKQLASQRDNAESA